MTFEEIEKLENIPVVTANADGCITHVNDVFLTEFKWSKDEIASQPLTVLMPPAFHDAHNLGFSRFITTGEAKILNQDLELKAVTKSGEERDVIIHIASRQKNNTWEFAATIQPKS